MRVATLLLVTICSAFVVSSSPLLDAQRDASALSDVNHSSRTLRKHTRSGLHHGSIKMRLRREGNNGKSEQLTTRHAKHRRRRKCRNRGGCGGASSRNGEIINQWRSSSENNNNKPRENNNNNKRTIKENEIETVDGKVGNETELNIAIVSLLESDESNKTPTKNRKLVDNVNDESWMQDSKDIVNGKSSMDKDDGFLDDALLSSVYMPIDDQIALHDSLATLLTRLFDNLKRNATDNNRQDLIEKFIMPEESSHQLNEDLCQRWLDSSNKLEGVFLGPLVNLPSCPCHFQNSIFYEDKIWDEKQSKYYRWRDVSGESQRLDIYKPGATYCIRSLLTQDSGSAAAQHCCYDKKRQLLTRGSGAGTPNFVSPEISVKLHERIDVLPWRLCKGDFTRFNRVRPPNNDNNCKANPDDAEYRRQINQTKYY